METINITLRTATPDKVAVNIAKMCQQDHFSNLYIKIGMDHVDVSLDYKTIGLVDVMELLATCNTLYHD